MSWDGLSLLVHVPELVVLKVVLHERALHRSIGSVGIHMAHLTWVTHGNPAGWLLFLDEVHIIVPWHAILAAEFEVEQFICIDSGVSEVETRREILLRAEGKGHKATVLHCQIGGIDALVGVAKLIRHGVAGVRHDEKIRITVLVRLILYEKACFGHGVARRTGRGPITRSV